MAFVERTESGFAVIDESRPLMFRSLKDPLFRLWFGSSFFSNAGFWAQSTAISWIVLTELTEQDTLAVGIALALQFAPQVVLAPLSGWIADRVSRRFVLQMTQSAWMLAGSCMGVVLLSGTAQLWHVFVFMAVFGTVNAFDAPARQTFVAELVGPAEVSNAIALNSASFNAARLVGPGVAGLMISMYGAGLVFILNSMAYAVLFFALILLKKSLRGGRRVDLQQPVQSVSPWRFIRERGDVQGVLVIALLVGMFGMNFPIISTAMTIELDGENAALYGVFSSLLGAGSLAGALYAAKRPAPTIRFILISLGMFAIFYGVSAVAPNKYVFGTSIIFLGFFLLALLSSLNGYVQINCVQELRGRVLAIYLAVLYGGTPFGGPLQGWIAGQFGVRWSFFSAAVAGAAALIVSSMLFSRFSPRRSKPRKE